MAHQVVDYVVDPLPQNWEEALKVLNQRLKEAEKEEKPRKA